MLAASQIGGGGGGANDKINISLGVEGKAILDRLIAEDYPGRRRVYGAFLLRLIHEEDMRRHPERKM